MQGRALGPAVHRRSLHLINRLALPGRDLRGREGVSPKEIRMGGGGGVERERRGKKGEFRRAMGRGLTRLLKIKSW